MASILALFDWGHTAVAFCITCVVAGLKGLGVFEKKPGGLFAKEGKEERLTLTEMFAKSQTKFHSLLIMYLLLFVVAVLVLIQVFPWQIMLFITMILMLLSDRKAFLKINPVLLLALVLLINVIM